MNIMMTPDEKQLYLFLIKSATSYFEYGMGGSTVLASNMIKGRVVSVDHDIKWIKTVKENVAASEFERTFIQVSIGETVDYGIPVEIGPASIYEPYFSAILKHDPKNFDLCFVDGRFRIACFFSCLLSVRKDAVIAIHDYRKRPHYHVIEKYARPICEAENLTACVARNDIDLDAVKEDLDRYVTDPY